VTGLPETTIKAAATDTAYFEYSEAWMSNASITLGKGFSRQDHTDLFGSRDVTAIIRNFRLRDVHLDTAAMTLIKDWEENL
jgi:hypothetical protein